MKQLLTLKKTLALLLAAALLLPFFAWAAPLEPLQPEEAAIAAISDEIIEEEITMAAAITPGIDLPVKSAILMDQASGAVLYAENEDVQLPPASITKVMSLLLIMEAIDSGKIALTDQVTCSDTASGYGGSQIWLKPGEVMTVDELLKAAAISSANDATVCLAEYVAGSEEAFVHQMNQRAQELGMQNTTFLGSTGLDEAGHLSTARDIAIMSRALLEHPLILNYSTVWMDTLRGGETQLVNTNRMVRFYKGATGLKTGPTNGAGSCLSATATRDGLGLIAVVMGADTSDHRFAAARSLLDWGFASFMQAQLSPPENLLPVPVTGGVQTQVEVVCRPPQEGILVEKGKLDAITQDVILPESAPAPIQEGQELGRVAVCVDGERVAEYPIVAAGPVERMSFGRALGILGNNLITMG